MRSRKELKSYNLSIALFVQVIEEERLLERLNKDHFFQSPRETPKQWTSTFVKEVTKINMKSQMRINI